MQMIWKWAFIGLLVGQLLWNSTQPIPPKSAVGHMIAWLQR